MADRLNGGPAAGLQGRGQDRLSLICPPDDLAVLAVFEKSYRILSASAGLLLTVALVYASDPRGGPFVGVQVGSPPRCRTPSLFPAGKLANSMATLEILLGHAHDPAVFGGGGLCIFVRRWPWSARQLETAEKVPAAGRRERLTTLAAFDCCPGILTVCGGRLRGRLGRLDGLEDRQQISLCSLPSPRALRTLREPFTSTAPEDTPAPRPRGGRCRAGAWPREGCEGCA